MPTDKEGYASPQKKSTQTPKKQPVPPKLDAIKLGTSNRFAVLEELGEEEIVPIALPPSQLDCAPAPLAIPLGVERDPNYSSPPRLTRAETVDNMDTDKAVRKAKASP